MYIIPQLLTYTADKIGPVNVLLMFSLGTAIFAFIWIAIRDTA